MKAYFCVSLLIFGFSLPSWALKPADEEKSSNESTAECTVDGHGPYDLKYSKCMQLGSDQAHTNCVLNEKDSKVEVQFSAAKNKKTAFCIARPKAGSEDCFEAKCTPPNDTPQH